MSAELPQTSAPSPITETPPDQGVIPLPPLQTPAVAPRAVEPGLGLDYLLAGLTLLFAFEMGLSAIRNADYYLTLAAGRDLLNGSYSPFNANDPYSWSGGPWVNHAWLYSGIVYLIHNSVGAAGVIVARGLLVVLAAYFMIRLGRVGRSWWAPALTAAVAVLVARPRLGVMQPFVVSVLFLVLTLYFLQRGGRWLARGDTTAPPGPVAWTDYWPLLLLFVAWVNLDEWFLLGPVTVLLYAAGQALQKPDTAASPRPGEVKALLTVGLAGLACCLLNPQHIFAFTLPPQLGFSGGASFFRTDSELKRLFWSPAHPEHFRRVALNSAHLVYFVLVLTTLISFLDNLRGFRWWRALAAGFFLVLSLYHARAVPFFAVVAAPIIALNFQEAVARRRELKPLKRRDPLVSLGRFLGFLMLVVLLAAGYVGWLLPAPFERNRVSLSEDIDPALKTTALYLGRLQDEGKLPPNARGFHFSYELGNALAWFAPQVKSSIDNRYAVFAQFAQPYVEVRRGLQAPPFDQDAPKWRDILRELQVDHVVLYSPDPVLLDMATHHLALDPVGKEPKHWALLSIEGSCAVYGWVKQQPAYAALKFDLDKHAYAPPEAKRAPLGGPQELPIAPPFWEAFTTVPKASTADAAEAAMYLQQFDRLAGTYQRRREFAYAYQLATEVVGGGLEGPLGMQSLTARAVLGAYLEPTPPGKEPSVLEGIAHELFRRYGFANDDGPMEYLWLAVRASRRALAHNPNNAAALEHLARAYGYLLRQTRERLWQRGIQARGAPLLEGVRRAQIAFALHSALQLRPNSILAHRRLAELLDELGGRDDRHQPRNGYLDLVLEHREAELKLIRARGREKELGEEEAAFRNRLQGMEKELKVLADTVDLHRKRLNNARIRLKTPKEEALKAAEMNLAGEAIKILVANEADLDDEGKRKLYELVLNTGRLELLSPQSLEEGLRDPVQADYFRLRFFAAIGNYELADRVLGRIALYCQRSPYVARAVLSAEIFPKGWQGVPELTESAGLGLIVGKALLDAPLRSWDRAVVPQEAGKGNFVFVAWQQWIDLSKDERVGQLQAYALQCLGPRFEEATALFLRGLLSLERGDADQAETHFADSVKVLKVLEPYRHLMPGSVRPLAEQFGKKIAEAKRQP